MKSMAQLHSMVPWWHPSVGSEDSAKKMVEHFKTLDNEQFWIPQRDVQHAWIYEPKSSLAIGRDYRFTFPDTQPDGENYVEAIVETGTNIVAKNRVRPYFATNNADWVLQREAEKLQKFSDGENRRLKIDGRVWYPAIRHGATFGLGYAYVHEGLDKRPACDLVLPIDLIADDQEWRPGVQAYSLCRRIPVNRWALAARFPKLAPEIHALANRSMQDNMWTDYRFIAEGCVMLLHAWHLPSMPGSKDGREVMAIHDGTLLSDEPWTLDHFPFAEFRWRPRLSGRYGVGLVESMFPMQRRVNRNNWFKNRAEDLFAIPRVFFMSNRDYEAKGKMDNALGRVYVCPSGRPPEFMTPPPAHPIIYSRSDQLGDRMFLLAGVSPGAAGGTAPGRFESGEAIVQWKDLSTDRHALPEMAAEEFRIDIQYLLLERAQLCAKKYGKGVVKTWYQARDVREEIDWSSIDMPNDGYSMLIQPASIADLTPAGQRQRIRNDVRDGLLSPDQIRQLNYQPDIVSMEHFQNSPQELMRDIILSYFKGKPVPMEPMLAVWPGALQMTRDALYYCQTKENCPPEVIESMVRLVEQVEKYQQDAIDAQMAKQQQQTQMLAPPQVDQAAGLPPPAAQAATPPLTPPAAEMM